MSRLLTLTLLTVTGALNLFGQCTLTLNPVTGLFDCITPPAAPAYAVTTFTNATSVTLNHNLNSTAVIASCWDSLGAQFQPNTIQYNSVNSVTFTFSTSTSGQCVVMAGVPTGAAVPGPQGATGATGAAGTNGNTVLNGTSNPTSQGVNGDFYLNTLTSCLYGPKSAGTWPASCTSLIGPTGPQGPQGPPGSGGGGGGSYTAGAGISAAQLATSVIALDSTLVLSYLNGTTSIDFPAITTQTCNVQTLTITGALAADKVVPAWPTTLDNGLIGMMFVSASNTVSIRLCNVTTSTIDPANMAYGAYILKPF